MRAGAASKGEWAVMFIPAARRSITIESAKRPLSVVLPGFIFFGISTRYYVWAMKGQAFDPRAPMFNAPVPNVHGNGSICFGQNKPPRATGAKIADAWLMFITSPFNSDLATGKSKQHKSNALAALRAFAKEDAYPHADLLPARSYRNTVDAIIDDLIKE
ncbi:MAG: hypothetical protein ACR2LC_09445 [Pyrinomonadaceae bacterium]